MTRFESTPCSKLGTSNQVLAQGRVAPQADVGSRGWLWSNIATAWSPRRTVRVDPDGTHDYTRAQPLAAHPPTVPYAVYLADRRGRFRLLAFDFDARGHGAEAAERDAAALARVLDELGAPHLRAHSGPGGGQHVWVRLAEPASAGHVTDMALALAHHYPTLDVAALRNPMTGCVRPPGAPHRSGGQSRLLLTGRALTRAVEQASAGAPAELAQWLTHRHPSPAVPVALRPRAAALIVPGPDGQQPWRLDTACRPLSQRAQQLLDTPVDAGADRSAVAHSALLSLARAGRSYPDVLALISIAPALARLREDVDRRGTGEVQRQWGQALHAAAGWAQGRTDSRHAGGPPCEAALRVIEAAIAATPQRWAARGGATDEKMLYALVETARGAGTLRIDIDTRRLGEAAACDHSTAARRLKVLEEQGWLKEVSPCGGTRAATWLLLDPPPSTNATQGVPAPPHILAAGSPLPHHQHDLWTPCAGLGPQAARTHWALLQGARDLTELATATGYGTRTVKSHLALLLRAGVVTPDFLPGNDRHAMDRAAERLGCSGAGEARARGHAADRLLWRWWLEEQEWRTSRGRKNGVPRIVDPDAIALPFAVGLRARFGRFPTRPTWRADYPAARAIVQRHSRTNVPLAAAA